MKIIPRDRKIFIFVRISIIGTDSLWGKRSQYVWRKIDFSTNVIVIFLGLECNKGVFRADADLF